MHNKRKLSNNKVRKSGNCTWLHAHSFKIWKHKILQDYNTKLIHFYQTGRSSQENIIQDKSLNGKINKLSLRTKIKYLQKYPAY